MTIRALEEAIVRCRDTGEGVDGPAARTLDATRLDDALVDARARTRMMLSDLDDCSSALASGWQVPLRSDINPPLWEYGHLAWFAEWWILRDPRPAEPDPDAPWCALRPSQLVGADQWFDSARVAHDSRWTLDLPPRTAILDFAEDVFERVRARLHAGRDDEALYPLRLALFHEDMHAEALTCLRQTVDYPAPAGVDATIAPIGGGGVVAQAGGRFMQGMPLGGGFAFDNELDAHPVELGPFEIDRDCVTNATFARFVDEGGYRDARWWPGDSGRWRALAGVEHPVRWRRGDDGDWQLRWFGRWMALASDLPVCHVNAYEAEAYCLWAGRRLPRESEWERAAIASEADGGGSGFNWGTQVWEWTADAFLPYAGFQPGRYREYSLPWFGTHRAVRGGSFATHPRMRHPRYRNFYTPERSDLFVGFRTCAR